MDPAAPLKRIYWRSIHLRDWAADRLLRWYLTRWFAPPVDVPAVHLGTEYGGHIIPDGLVGCDWVCYCCGVGEDTSFDTALMQNYGCTVHAFDPTPRAKAHVKREHVNQPGYRFQPVGIWSQDRTMRFHAPQLAEHVSHSITNLQQNDEGFDAECRRLSTLMREAGHERIDLLKLDIEGAEYEVVSDMLDAGISPTVLTIEFDRPFAPSRVAATMRRLAHAGYRTLAINGDMDVSFVHMQQYRALRQSQPHQTRQAA